MPNSSTASRSRPITRCAAISKPSTSKICEPMWLCRPTRRRLSASNTRRDRVHRVAAGEREAELLVLVRGGDELVGVRLDADGHADQHVLHHAGRTGDRLEPVDLDRASRRPRARHRHATAASSSGPTCCCRAGDSLGREAGAQRDRQFAAGAHVEREALVPHPARDLAAQERLGRVVHGRASARTRAAMSRQRERKSSSSIDEQRGAVLARRARATGTPASRTTPSSPRTALRGQTFAGSAVNSPGVGRDAAASVGACGTSACRGPAGCALIYHLRSGALRCTPSRARPLAEHLAGGLAQREPRRV